MVEDGVEDGRDAEKPRDAVALDLLHQGDRVEPPEHDVAPADHRQEVGEPPAVDVEEGHDVERDVGLRELDGDLRVEGVEVEGPVGERDALGEPGRPARVEELGHRVLVDLRVARIGGAAGQECFVFVGGDPARLALEDDEAGPGRELGRDGLDEGREVAVEEDDLAPGVVEDVGDLARGQPDVDRVEDGARFEDAVVALEEVVGVVRDEADPVAGLDAEADQGVRQAVGSLTEGRGR